MNNWLILAPYSACKYHFDSLVSCSFVLTCRQLWKRERISWISAYVAENRCKWYMFKRMKHSRLDIVSIVANEELEWSVHIIFSYIGLKQVTRSFYFIFVRVWSHHHRVLLWKGGRIGHHEEVWLCSGDLEQLYHFFLKNYCNKLKDNKIWTVTLNQRKLLRKR